MRKKKQLISILERSHELCKVMVLSVEGLKKSDIYDIQTLRCQIEDYLQVLKK